MTFYLPIFWVGFFFGALACLIVLFTIAYLASKRKEAKQQGEKNGDSS